MSFPNFYFNKLFQGVVAESR